uniref:Uncharacterized protein n=1 Tax=Kalanchoe fedtschenkoi TaxID=63787 RepID=A0A7N0UVK4_KALFE
MCLTCPSVSHLSCTMSGDHAMRYECRHCHNRNPSLFEFKFDGRRRGGKGEEIDLDSAGKLFAAAWIASASLQKAAVATRAEADRRAGEVVVARKKAKEALERLASLTSREDVENGQNGSGLMRIGQTSGAGAGSGGNTAGKLSQDGEGGSKVTKEMTAVVGKLSRNGNAGLNLSKKRKH